MDHTLSLPEDNSPGLQWLPDDSGWLLHGNTICLAHPVLAVWQLKHRPHYGDFRHLIVDEQHMLVAGGTANRGRFIGISVPWAEIRKRCRQATSRQPLYGAPPVVRLVVKVGDARFADATVVRDKIAARLKEALYAQGVQVRESAECMLVIDYTESAGTPVELSVGASKRQQVGTKCEVQGNVIVPTRQGSSVVVAFCP